MIGTNLHVPYITGPHDATSQSERQKYSIIRYLTQVKPEPKVWICNFLLMKNLGMRPLNELVGKHKHNILPNSFDLKYLFQKACLQNKNQRTITLKKHSKVTVFLQSCCVILLLIFEIIQIP